MKVRRAMSFVLAATLIMTVSGFTAHAQAQTPAQDLNLTNAQVFKIQALMMSQTARIRTLSHDVQVAEDALNAAIAKGDPVLTAMAVLSLDAAEKALKNTELANRQNLLSLLNDSQKQIVRDYQVKSVPASEE
jgi:hypothetical protein